MGASSASVVLTWNCAIMMYIYVYDVFGVREYDFHLKGFDMKCFYSHRFMWVNMEFTGISFSHLLQWLF